MRRYLTLGIKKNGSATITNGPEKPYSEHLAAFRALPKGSKKGNSEFAEVHVIDLSRGVIKHQRNSAVKFKGEGEEPRAVLRQHDPKRARKEAEPTPRRTVLRRRGAAPTPKVAAPTRKASKASRRAAAFKVGTKAPAHQAPAKVADEGTFDGPDSTTGSGPALID